MPNNEQINADLDNALELLIKFNDFDYLNQIAENKEILKDAIRSLAHAIGFIFNVISEQFPRENKNTRIIKS